LPRVYDPKTHKNVDLPLTTSPTLIPTGGLTATELRESAVPVSGTVATSSFFNQETLPVNSENELELLTAILTELRVIANILNEGLNTKEDIDTLRADEESDQE
jgi:hypothetical protein